MSEPDISLTLPLPPSANRIWRKGRGGKLHKATDYTAWQRECEWYVAVQRAADSVPGHFRALITLPRTRIDLDNFCKPALDILQHTQVIKNDRLCREVTLRRDDTRGRETMLVELWSLGEPLKPKRGKGLRMAVPLEPLR